MNTGVLVTEVHHLDTGEGLVYGQQMCRPGWAWRIDWRLKPDQSTVWVEVGAAETQAEAECDAYDAALRLCARMH